MTRGRSAYTLKASSASRGDQHVGGVIRDHRADHQPGQRTCRTAERTRKHRRRHRCPRVPRLSRPDQPRHLGLEPTPARSQPVRRGDEHQPPHQVGPVDRELQRDGPAGADAVQEHRLTKVVLDGGGQMSGDVRHRLAMLESSLAVDDIDGEVARQRLGVSERHPTLPTRGQVMLRRQPYHRYQRRGRGRSSGRGRRHAGTRRTLVQASRTSLGPLSLNRPSSSRQGPKSHGGALTLSVSISERPDGITGVAERNGPSG